MIDFFKSGGPYMWVLLIAAVIIIIHSVRCIIELSHGKGTDHQRVSQMLQGILFWGVFSAVAGIFGQISGIYLALSEILRATDISPQVIALGIKLSFHTTLFGMGILLVSGLIWYPLRLWFIYNTGPAK